MDIFFRMFSHLLPRAAAFVITEPLRRITQFFSGLSVFGDNYKKFVDDVYDDRFPATTRDILANEGMFHPPESMLTPLQRRERLDRLWARKGGQSPSYIASILADEGFVGLNISEWWVPGTEPPVGASGCATTRDPNTAGAGSYCISNKRSFTTGINDIISRAGRELMRAGNINATSGRLGGANEQNIECILPLDPLCWNYIFYVHGASFGVPGTVPLFRRDELENLLMTLKPAHQWVVFHINYV